MNFLVIFCAIILLLGLNMLYLSQMWFTSRSLKESYHDDLINLQLLKFNNYLTKFNKSYSGDEFYTRLQNFKDSLAEIARLNAIEGDTVFGLTQFSDMAAKDYEKMMLVQSDDCTKKNLTCGGRNVSRTSTNDYSNGDIPKTFDWRNHGCLSPVLNQKLCVGCWAFSIVGVMECMLAKRNISHERLSIQELLDCTDEGNGCRGRRVSKALEEFCLLGTPVTTEEMYPMTLKDQHPDSCNSTKSGIRIKEYGYQCAVNEKDMLRQIANYGPIIAIIHGIPLRNYIRGIIRRACYKGNMQNGRHAVQLIGYDITGIVPYYIVKNTYGQEFGENGYFRLAVYGNVCGVSDEVAFIDVE